MKRTSVVPGLTKILLIGLMLLPAACRSARNGETEVPKEATPPAEVLDTQKVEADARAGGGGSGAPSDLGGYLITLSATPAGIQNRAMRHDLTTGERETLWTTEQGANISDWSPSPDRQRVAYRSILRSTPTEAVESLIVRDLEVGAEALVVAAADTSISRFAGFVWSPDGSSLAYGRQFGGLLGAAETDAGAQLDPVWELHVVRAAKPNGGSADDRVIWQQQGDSERLSGLALVAWHPDSATAAIQRVATDSGIIEGFTLVDTDMGVVRDSVAPGGLASESLASPDGRWLALPDADGPRTSVRLLELSTGRLREIGEPVAQAQVGALLWSPDSSWLAWAEDDTPAPEPGSRIHIASLKSMAQTRMDFLPALGARPLAFSPDGAWLLAGESGEMGMGWVRYPIYSTEGEAETEPTWDPPPDSWAVYWSQ
jgi:dipeptidyl aminopeptidase/acylaminoacyl peptidase